jgi:hypothetical protein
MRDVAMATTSTTALRRHASVTKILTSNGAHCWMRKIIVPNWYLNFCVCLSLNLWSLSYLIRTVKVKKIIQLIYHRRCFNEIPNDFLFRQDSFASMNKPLPIITQIHSWMNLCIATVGSPCVWLKRPEFLTEDLLVGCITCSVRLLIGHTKPDKQISLSSFPFPVPSVEDVWKILKKIIFIVR